MFTFSSMGTKCIWHFWAHKLLADLAPCNNASRPHSCPEPKEETVALPHCLLPSQLRNCSRGGIRVCRTWAFQKTNLPLPCVIPKSMDGSRWASQGEVTSGLLRCPVLRGGDPPVYSWEADWHFKKQKRPHLCSFPLKGWKQEAGWGRGWGGGGWGEPLPKAFLEDQCVSIHVLVSTSEGWRESICYLTVLWGSTTVGLFETL